MTCGLPQLAGCPARASHVSPHYVAVKAAGGGGNYIKCSWGGYVRRGMLLARLVNPCPPRTMSALSVGTVPIPCELYPRYRTGRKYVVCKRRRKLEGRSNERKKQKFKSRALHLFGAVPWIPTISVLVLFSSGVSCSSVFFGFPFAFYLPSSSFSPPIFTPQNFKK